MSAKIFSRTAFASALACEAITAFLCASCSCFFFSEAFTASLSVLLRPCLLVVPAICTLLYTVRFFFA